MGKKLEKSLKKSFRQGSLDHAAPIQKEKRVVKILRTFLEKEKHVDSKNTESDHFEFSPNVCVVTRG